MSFWVYDDGGRQEAGFRGQTGDCVTRAIAIATGRPYREVYDALFDLNREYAKKARGRLKNELAKSHRRSPRNGVYKKIYGQYLRSIGWVWVPTMRVNQVGPRVRLCPDDLPEGRIICQVTRHLVAVIDGVAHDIYDSTYEGTRQVFGYYTGPQ